MGAPERLREHKDDFSQIPPQLVEGTTDDVCRLSQHQIGPMRGSGTVHMRCALAQTTVCHEPLRFSKSFYVAQCHTLVLAMNTHSVVYEAACENVSLTGKSGDLRH